MPRRHDYTPDPAFFEAWPEGVSGNALNGLGETAPRRASPMFWHPPHRHPFGPLQVYARARSRANPEAGELGDLPVGRDAAAGDRIDRGVDALKSLVRARTREAGFAARHH